MTTIAHEISSGYRARRPVRLHYPSISLEGSPDDSISPKLPLLPGSTRRHARSPSPQRSAAIQGMHGVSTSTRKELLALAPVLMTKLECMLEKSDPRRTGVLNLQSFEVAVQRAQFFVSKQAFEEIVASYTLDNQGTNIWWAAFLREAHLLRESNGALNPKQITEDDFRRPWEGISSPKGGGVPGIAAPYFDFLPQSPTWSIDSPVVDNAEFSEDAERMLMELANFFKTRRVNVVDAFADFNLPGRFCKRVKHVTRSQFKEALYFLTKGLQGLTEDHVLLLCETFDDGTGLVKYRDFVKAVDIMLEAPGSAGFSPHAADSSPSKLAIINKSASPTIGRAGSRTSAGSSLVTSPVLSARSYGSLEPRSPILPSLPQTCLKSEDYVTKTAKLLGVQPMGPESCQMPSRIEVFTRIKVDEIMARIRQSLHTYNILLKDHLRISDKHSEGYITCNHFRRQMNQLRVFKISEEEFDALNRSYEGKVGGEIRFNYRRFCEDLQPTGPDAEEKITALSCDNSQTSPLAVKQVSEDELSKLNVLMDRLGSVMRHKRINVRAFFADFDRVCKTRKGGTPHNYTLHPGCVSRSQLQQALAKMQLSDLVDADTLTVLYKRYDREGDFNHLVFMRDLEEIQDMQELRSEMAIQNRLKGSNPRGDTSPPYSYATQG